MAKPRTDERSSSSNKNIDLPEDVLKKLLTPSEIRMLKNRWLIVQHLKEGLSIRAIATKIKVGTDTVVRVSRMVERNNSLKESSKSANGEHSSYSSKPPWVFGKSED